MDALYQSAADHMGSRMLLAKFQEHYIYSSGHKTAESVTQYKPARPLPRKFTTDRPWHSVDIDVMGPFLAIRGMRFIISLIDVFSHYVILFPTADHKAYIMATDLFQHQVTYFGVPAVVLSDL